MGCLEMARQVEQRMAREKIPSPDSEPQPAKTKRNAWAAVRYVADRPVPVSEEEIADKTVMELVNGPFVIRFDLPRHGRVYFIGLDDALHAQLTSEGKTVRWLHELFQGIQDKLGISSIYRWTLARVWATQAGLEVFQGARVKEARE